MGVQGWVGRGLWESRGGWVGGPEVGGWGVGGGWVGRGGGGPGGGWVGVQGW